MAFPSKCISIHSLYENAYDSDVTFNRVKNIVEILKPDVVFVAMLNDILPSIKKIVEYLKSLKVSVGIISDNPIDPYLFKNNFINIFPDYFVYTEPTKKQIEFIDTKIISRPDYNVCCDYLLESDGPTHTSGFCITDNFDNITNTPFCVKAMDTNYQNNYLTEKFMENWNKF